MLPVFDPQAQPRIAPKQDGTPASALFFEGGASVHGLFDFLMCETALKDAADAASDVPVLLAPTPFAGASLTRLQAKVRWIGIGNVTFSAPAIVPAQLALALTCKDAVAALRWQQRQCVSLASLILDPVS